MKGKEHEDENRTGGGIDRDVYLSGESENNVNQTRG
jgi:hypothetical protein